MKLQKKLKRSKKERKREAKAFVHRAPQVVRKAKKLVVKMLKLVVAIKFYKTSLLLSRTSIITLIEPKRLVKYYSASTTMVRKKMKFSLTRIQHYKMTSQMSSSSSSSSIWNTAINRLWTRPMRTLCYEIFKH